MEKIETFEEVKRALKSKEIITTSGKDSFHFYDGYVIYKFNGNAFKVEFNTFIELYKDTTFYYLEDEQETVDLKKDEEYYEKIQKHN